MTLPDYSNLLAGTALTWKASGGDYVITLTSLASAAAREGAKSATLVNGTYGMPELLEVLFTSAVAVAAVTGTEIELFFAESDSATAGTNNPAGLTGADAGVTNPTQWRSQCYPVGSIVMANAAGTAIQKQRMIYIPTQPYIIPLVVNSAGQALSGTAGDHVITVTPFYRRVQD